MQFIIVKPTKTSISDLILSLKKAKSSQAIYFSLQQKKGSAIMTKGSFHTLPFLILCEQIGQKY